MNKEIQMKTNPYARGPVSLIGLGGPIGPAHSMECEPPPELQRPPGQVVIMLNDLHDAITRNHVLVQQLHKQLESVRVELPEPTKQKVMDTPQQGAAMLDHLRTLFDLINRTNGQLEYNLQQVQL